MGLFDEFGGKQQDFNFYAPVAGKFGGGFNDPRSGGKRQHHAGDWMASAGSPVYAPGNVEFVTGGKGGTNLRPNDYWAYFRDTDTGLEYRMAHIGDVSKFKPGQKFQRGEQITEVGNVISSPHLHMSIWDTQNNKPVNYLQDIGWERGKEVHPGTGFMLGSAAERKASKIAATVPQKGTGLFDEFAGGGQESQQGTGMFDNLHPQKPQKQPTSVRQPSSDMPGIGDLLMPKFPADIPQQAPAQQDQEPPTIGKLVYKTLFGGGGLDKIKENLSRYLGPQGVAEFEKDINVAMKSPEMAAWGAIDPMVGMVSQVPKGGIEAMSLLGKKSTTKTPELTALDKVVGMEKFDPKQMQQLADKAKEFGIDLTVPELTNSPTLRALWTRLAKTPGPQSEKLATYLEEIRNPQVDAAIRQELGNISPTSLTAYQAGGQARAAAQNIEDKIVSTRKAVTQPLYKAAFDNPQSVDIGPILENLTQQIAKYPEGHPSRAALQQAERMLTKDAEETAQRIIAQGGMVGPVEGKRVPVTDLETLHNAKTGIDQLLEKAKADKSIDNDTRRLLMRIKSQLVGRMEADNPLYGRAQQTFRLLSKPLNDFRFGNPNIAPRDPHVSTIIKQLADLPEANLEKAVDIVFSANRPQQIAKTKAYFDKAYPGTWDAMVRTKLEQQLNKIRDTVAQREGNAGGVFKRTVFKNAQDRNIWRVAMGPEKFNRFEGFMDVLDKTRRIIYTNSETAFQIEAGKILEQGGFEELMKSVPTSTGGIIKWLASRFDKLQQPKFAAQLADAMLDPQNAIELTKLRRMVDNPRKAFATAQFLDNAVFKGMAGRQESPIEPRQSGGPVESGKPYLVGEMGPEMVMSTEPEKPMKRGRKDFTILNQGPY